MIDLDLLGLVDIEEIDAGAALSSVREGGTLIPVGWHVAIVRSAEQKNDNGKSNVEVNYEIVHGAAKGRKIRDRIQVAVGNDEKAERVRNRMLCFLHQFGLVEERPDAKKKSGKCFAGTKLGWQDLTLTPTYVLIQIQHKKRQKKNEATDVWEDVIDPNTNAVQLDAALGFAGICNVNTIDSRLSKKDAEACQAVVRSWNAGGEGVASGAGVDNRIPAPASHKDLNF